MTLKNLELNSEIKNNLENLDQKIEKMDRNVTSIKDEHNELVQNFENQLHKVLNEEE